MRDFDNPDTLYWGYLMPGIIAWGKQHGCDFFMDGFAPAFRKEGKSVQIDMNKIVALAKEDKYDAVRDTIFSYIEEITR